MKAGWLRGINAEKAEMTEEEKGVAKVPIFLHLGMKLGKTGPHKILP